MDHNSRTGQLAVAGPEWSWLHLVIPNLLFLIPLVRFPGFIWLIAVGLSLPKIPRFGPLHLEPRHQLAWFVIGIALFANGIGGYLLHLS